MAGATISKRTSIWTRQGIGLVQGRVATRGAAFWAPPIFVKLLHGLRLREQKYDKVLHFEWVGIPTRVEVLFI